MTAPGIIAVADGAVVAEPRPLPDYPLLFLDGELPRWEDDLICHTWKKYMQTLDTLPHACELDATPRT